jgi:hypothetical protein
MIATDPINSTQTELSFKVSHIARILEDLMFKRTRSAIEQHYMEEVSMLNSNGSYDQANDLSTNLNSWIDKAEEFKGVDQRELESLKSIAEYWDYIAHQYNFLGANPYKG